MPTANPIEALYYPRAEFPSSAWVKASLLYWEGLQRIVPDGHTPNDPPEVKELVEAGMIQDLSPSAFRSAAMETFGVRLEDLLQSRGGKPFEDAPSTGSAQGGHREGSVHLTELDRSLVNELESKHLLSTEGEWARMAPEMVRLYQITMATEASAQLFTAPVTDDEACDVASTYFSVKKVARDPEDVSPDGLRFAQLYCPFPSLEAAGALSVERLIYLRTRYGKLRRAYRDTIQARTAAIATLPTTEAIRKHLEHLAAELEEDLQVARDELRASRVKDAWTLIGVSAPITAGAATTLVGAPAIAVAAGALGTVGLGLLDWYLQRDLRKRSDGHYLLALGRNVDHGAPLARIRDRMQQLTHGAR